jgi:hypothetical protein
MRTEVNIFVILLEENRYFVFGTTHEDENFTKIKKECELLYNFPKQYRPILVVDQYTNRSVFDIQSIVLQYMYKYGVYNVRGGIYQNTDLTDKEINEITNHFHLIKDLNVNTQVHDFIYKEIQSKSKEELRELFINTENKWEKMRESERISKDIKNMLFHNIENIKNEYFTKMDYYFIEKMQDFKEVLLEYKKEDTTQEIIEEYSKEKYQEMVNILLNLYTINEVYSFINNDEDMPIIIWNTPNVNFDNFFNNRKYDESIDEFVIVKPSENYLNKALKLYEKYETVMYIVLNRLNEYEYDTYSLKTEGIAKKMDILLYTIE